MGFYHRCKRSGSCGTTSDAGGEEETQRVALSILRDFHSVRSEYRVNEWRGSSYHMRAVSEVNGSEDHSRHSESSISTNNDSVHMARIEEHQQLKKHHGIPNVE